MMESLLFWDLMSWWMTAIAIIAILWAWYSHQYESWPFTHNIETGYGNYHNGALPHDKFGVQVSESNDNTPPLLDVTAELSRPYVQACRATYTEGDVRTGIQYLNTIGGTSHVAKLW
jgi:hypothetical protein